MPVDENVSLHSSAARLRSMIRAARTKAWSIFVTGPALVLPQTDRQLWRCGRTNAWVVFFRQSILRVHPKRWMVPIMDTIFRLTSSCWVDHERSSLNITPRMRRDETTGKAELPMVRQHWRGMLVDRGMCMLKHLAVLIDISCCDAQVVTRSSRDCIEAFVVAILFPDETSVTSSA